MNSAMKTVNGPPYSYVSTLLEQAPSGSPCQSAAQHNFCNAFMLPCQAKRYSHAIEAHQHKQSQRGSSLLKADTARSSSAGWTAPSSGPCESGLSFPWSGGVAQTCCSSTSSSSSNSSSSNSSSSSGNSKTISNNISKSSGSGSSSSKTSSNTISSSDSSNSNSSGSSNSSSSCSMSNNNNNA